MSRRPRSPSRAISAMPDWDKSKPLEFFFPRLVALNAVKVALRKEFRKRAGTIITKLKNRLPLSDDDLGAHDVIADIVGNESKVVASLCWKPISSEDMGYINMMRYGTGRFRRVYWIEEEGSSKGYFGSLKAAKEYGGLYSPGDTQTWWE